MQNSIEIDRSGPAAVPTDDQQLEDEIRQANEQLAEVILFKPYCLKLNIRRPMRSTVFIAVSSCSLSFFAMLIIRSLNFNSALVNLNFVIYLLA